AVRRVGGDPHLARPAPGRPERAPGADGGAGGGRREVARRDPAGHRPAHGPGEPHRHRYRHGRQPGADRVRLGGRERAAALDQGLRPDRRSPRPSHQRAGGRHRLGRGDLRQGSDVLAKAATSLQGTLGRVDSATNQGQLATILNNSAATSANLRSASQDFHDLLESAHKNQESLVRTLVAADSVMSRIANRTGSLRPLVSDSTLYKETTLTMIQLRQLLSDIQANPRKYFTFSVF